MNRVGELQVSCFSGSVARSALAVVSSCGTRRGTRVRPPARPLPWCEGRSEGPFFDTRRSDAEQRRCGISFVFGRRPRRPPSLPPYIALPSFGKDNYVLMLELPKCHAGLTVLFVIISRPPPHGDCGGFMSAMSAINTRGGNSGSASSLDILPLSSNAARNRTEERAA